jgi:uncharacterized protein
MPTELDIELCSERLVLLVERALYWPRAETLFVADIHLGKAAAFRASSIAVPEGTMGDDLARLSRALSRTDARRLVLLGDLLHARKGRAESILASIAAWRAEHRELEILLVRGNHDLHAGDPPPEWNITCTDAPVLMPPFVLQHEPVASGEGYTLSGHLHPGVRLTGSARQEIALPCFWFGRRIGVLPAFSAFTGLALVRPVTGDQVFVVVDDEVIAVT